MKPSVRNIAALFDARSIAVIGASDVPGRFSHTPLRNLRRYGYDGDVYPINPRGGEVEGWPCLRGMAELPQVPDHAIIAVRAANVPPVLTQCVDMGVKAVTVLASGFGEVNTEEGHELERQVDAAIAGAGIALVGPNSLGIANFNRKMVPFASTILPDTLAPGRIAIVSQSGGVGFTILGRAWHAGIGVGYLVGTGNESVLTVSDYIEHFIDRDDVSVVACYFESIRDPERFLAASLRAASVGKPVVVLRAGRSEVGQRAAAAHTGAIASVDVVATALLEQHGVIEVQSIEALVTAAGLFASYGPPRGTGVGIYAQGGGAAVMMSDKFSAAGIDLPMPAEATRAELKALLPDTSPGNPLDSGGQFLGGGEDTLARALNGFAADPAFDMVVHTLLSLTGGREHVYADAVTRAIKDVAKPQLVLQYCAGDMAAYSRKMFRDNGVIAIDQPDAAVGGIAAWLSYDKATGRARRRLAAASALRASPLQAATRADLEARMARGDKAVLEFDAKRILAGYGLPVSREQIVHAAADAVTAAGDIGFPVVLKLLSHNLTHRAGTGTIELGLDTPEDVAAAFDRIVANARRLGVAIDGMLVAQQVSGPLELIAGVQTDPVYGPVVMAGMGGIWVEVLKDVGFLPVDLGADDVAELLGELRSGKLLNGYRGGPTVTPQALAAVLEPLAAFARDTVGLVEAVDINPLIVGKDGSLIAVDALIILASGEGSN